MPTTPRADALRPHSRRCWRRRAGARSARREGEPHGRRHRPVRARAEDRSLCLFSLVAGRSDAGRHPRGPGRRRGRQDETVYRRLDDGSDPARRAGGVKRQRPARRVLCAPPADDIHCDDDLRHAVDPRFTCWPTTRRVWRHRFEPATGVVTPFRSNTERRARQAVERADDRLPRRRRQHPARQRHGDCRPAAPAGRPVRPGAGQRYWEIFEQLRRAWLRRLPWRPAALPHRASARAHAQIAFHLLHYPFADRVYPGALAAIARLRARGPVVILSDGDVVFQPRKIERSGLWAAVEGRVLIYIHKEEMLADVEERYPARRYVMIDDKVRILAAMKAVWHDRLTTVFVRQGHYASDAALLAHPTRCDVERIAMSPASSTSQELVENS